MKAAWIYHQRTKHSLASLRAQRHHLQWDIKPLPFKIYKDIEPLALPRQIPVAGMPAIEAVARAGDAGGSHLRVPDCLAVARLLHLAAGITRSKTYPGGEEYHFRAAACTGALYHIDVYAVCAELPGLSAGVYHFGPHNSALHRLREGDCRGLVVEATAAEPSVRRAPVVLACASTYWRNSWKYQARAYRHCFWDSGTMLANLLAAAAADGGMPARVICGFADASIDALLGLDRAREGTLALVSLGRDTEARTPAAAPVAARSFATLPLSSSEVDYPIIREMHIASALAGPDEVRSWRSGATQAPTWGESPAAGSTVPLRPLADAELPGESLDAVIRRRGSTRRFARAPITFEQLSTLLQRATQGAASDFGASPNVAYLIVNAVSGLQPGAYVFHRGAGCLELLRAGGFRRQAGHLALGQELAADASVNVYFLCDLEAVLARFGDRGYRVAQLDAALAGGRLYLCAYALRLGATGLTFFDDEVTEFFSPHAAGKSVMFLVAAGHGARALRAA